MNVWRIFRWGNFPQEISFTEMSVLGIAHKEDDLESGKWAKSMSTLNDEKFLSEKNLGQRKIKAEGNLDR